MTQESFNWLQENIDIWERQKQGNDKHLNDREMAALKDISRDVDGEDTELATWCFHCRQKLIKVVFEAYEQELEASAAAVVNGGDTPIDAVL